MSKASANDRADLERITRDQSDQLNRAAVLATLSEALWTLQAGLVVLVLAGGGLAIATGTLLFGRRLVHMVGSGITRLNPVRAFCISSGTAITVLGASLAGLPVSTTHIAVGGVFGVGFFREWHDRRRRKSREALPAAEVRRRVLVRRSHLTSIIAAWLVTVPAAALLSAAIQWLSQGLIGG